MDETTAFFLFVILPLMNLAGAFMAIRHFSNRKSKNQKERSGNGC